MKHTVLLLCAAVLLCLCACAQPAPAPSQPTIPKTESSTTQETATLPSSETEQSMIPETELTTEANAEPSGFQVLLYGENHENAACLEKELEAWEALYDSGARHLFIEYSYANVANLNRWMRGEIEMFDDGAESGEETEPLDVNIVPFFYRAIKARCPETVFHGTDVEHEYDTVGAEYLAYLESIGEKDSEEYVRVAANCEQGKRTHQDGETDEGFRYREICLFDNFAEELERLEPQTVMGIYGRQHVDLGTSEAFLNGDPNMAARLAERYGDRIQCTDLSMIKETLDETRFQPEGPITLNGKTYETVFTGAHDYSVWAIPIQQVVYWRLVDSDPDFTDCAVSGVLEPLLAVCDKNLFFRDDVYCAVCTARDGSVQRRYFRGGVGRCNHGIPCLDVAEGE